MKNKIVERVQKYLSRMGVECRLESSAEKQTGLPLFVSTAFDCFESVIQESHYILVVPREEEVDAEMLASTADTIRSRRGADVVFCLSQCSRPKADFLRQAGVAFIVPGRLVFIPPKLVWAVDRAYADGPAHVSRHLSPRAQAFVIRYLLCREMPSELAYREVMDMLSCKQYEVTRIAQELRGQGLAEIQYRHPSAAIVFQLDREALWRQAEELMLSPVRKVVTLDHAPAHALIAGLPALSRMSDLLDGGEQVAAVFLEAQEVKALEAARVYKGVDVDIWRYDPRPLARNGMVDPISLYLSLRGQDDPRVVSALEKLIGGVL